MRLVAAAKPQGLILIKELRGIPSSFRIKEKVISSQAPCHMSPTYNPSNWELEAGDQEFKDILNYIDSSRPA